MPARCAAAPAPATPAWSRGVACFVAYTAFSLSGPWDGLVLVLSMVWLHMALGIELRHRRGPRSTLGARIGRELRERFLSRLGLADDDHDAAARTRDRAARRAAYLATAHWTLLRHTRLRRALHQAVVAHDPAQRDRMLADLAALQHVSRQRKLDLPAPW